MEKVGAITMLILAVVVSAGCATSTNTSSQTLSASVSPTATPANVADLLTSKYEADDYKIITAFSRQTNNTYSGVVRRNNSSLFTNVTFVKLRSEGDARAHFATLLNEYKSRSYVTDLETANNASLSKSTGIYTRELVQIFVENLGINIGWGVIKEETSYVIMT